MAGLGFVLVGIPTDLDTWRNSAKSIPSSGAMIPAAQLVAMVVGGANGEPGWGCFAFPGTGSCSRAGLASSCGEATWWSPEKKEIWMHRSLLLVVTLLALLAAPVAAQEATPGATSQASASTAVASGLANPRGFLWTADGTLFVAQAGAGGE
jgi:hypothetical protein